MEISQLCINGTLYRSQTRVDLIQALNKPHVKSIVVIYGLAAKKTEYVRNIHNKQWYKIKDKGEHCNKLIRVVREGRNLVIKDDIR